MSKQSKINPKNHVRLIYTLLNKYFGFLHEERDELVNQCYLLLYKAAKNYKPEKAAFSSYAMWYMKVGLINYLKKINKHKPHPFIEENYPTEINNGPSKIDIERILHTLSPKERKFICQYYGGLFLKDIAKKENVTTAALSQRKSKIIKKLQNNLRERKPIDYF